LVLKTGRAPIDYLVVETSGLSDPIEVTQVIEYELDCAVHLYSSVFVMDIDNHSSVLETSVSQLGNADVILLNKVDLLEEKDQQLDMIQASISRHTSARILPCAYSDVPLELLMDVQKCAVEREAFGRIPQRLGERAHLEYLILGSSDAAAAAARETKLISRPSSSASTSDKHSRLDGGWQTLSFESTHALDLVAFQRVLLSFGDRLARAKGDVFFDCLPNERLSFELSGHRRVQVQRLGRRPGIRVALALVLRGGSPEDLQELREALSTTYSNNETTLAKICARLKAAGEGNWDVEPFIGSVLRIRLTGFKKYGFSCEQLLLKFGVHLDQVQDVFCKCINSYGRGMVCISDNDGGVLVVGIESKALDEALLAAAKATFRAEFFHVTLCGCD
jgi:G3E family GTPase